MNTSGHQSPGSVGYTTVH